MTLTTHQAAITTATVEIRMLTVDRRAMTLAVFRQLLSQSPEDDQGNLVGELWGVVNYHPDGCQDHPHHLHVVWQRGTDLYRAHMRPPSPPGETHWCSERRSHQTRCYRQTRSAKEAGAWLAAALLDGWRPKEGTWCRGEGTAGTEHLHVTFDSTDPDAPGLGERRLAVPLEGPALGLLMAEEQLAQAEQEVERMAASVTYARYLGDARKRVEQTNTRIGEAIADLEAILAGHPDLPPEPARARSTAACWVGSQLAAEEECHARRVANWEVVAEIGQLFIAT